MNTIGKNLPVDINNFITNNKNITWDLSSEELVNKTISMNMGKLCKNGALAIDTGAFTGRSPKDRFIVKDRETSKNVDWGDINQICEETNYNKLKNDLIKYLTNKNTFGRRAYACAEEKFQLNICLITEYPWSNLFGYNMFLRPSKKDLIKFKHNWTILCAPGFKANNPSQYGVRQENFSIINFKEKVILIGGSGYTGEIKKGIFSVLNYTLPQQEKVLSMHCSANIGVNNDTSLFFGLSGTGKTTLSADPDRKLIGDDEHGWSNNSIFNFEGGCYAKCINLSADSEPDIFKAIKKGALLENICFDKNNEIDFSNCSKTENTRVSYPINHIENIARPSIGPSPKNIFFLTADAFGVLPPISKLTKQQAMYHFISGYTSKIAGTEDGIVEPQATFSACFGAPFMPLHPTMYAQMLGEKIENENVNVWLINTGWSGGEYGIGKRIKLNYTRAMINAAMNNKLNDIKYIQHEIFGLYMPETCINVPSKILHPINTWNNTQSYQEKAKTLAKLFQANFFNISESTNDNANINKEQLALISKGGPIQF
ncbi:MAG: phosphoenolpyruvate carboxykinase (ATP) [Flavobacteriales bacterium TMED191]|nr:MAG: phosphoenolpyruvate carboxykinase (ATP) [Flavobacteriales bacterium TMED191]